jgi:hypothetical protein
MEKFSVLERKLLQNLRAEAGRRETRKLFSKVFSEKSSSLIVKAAQKFSSKKCGFSKSYFCYQENVV